MKKLILLILIRPMGSMECVIPESGTVIVSEDEVMKPLAFPIYKTDQASVYKFGRRSHIICTWRENK